MRYIGRRGMAFQDVDIIMPCALENQLTPEVFTKISDNVKVICEGANGPTTPTAIN